MAEALGVYWDRRLAGRLWEESGLRFRYAPQWLSAPDAAPLSVRLPLGEEAFGPERARTFFANLLPEGDVRARIARNLRVSESNDFARLAALGGDCAGALSLMPEGAPLGERGGYQAVSEEELARMIEEAPRRPLLAAREGLRLSLAGAQEKIPVYIKEGRVHLPLGDAPSSHILKPAIERFEDTVENEAFCMALAAEAGLSVPKAAVRPGRTRAYVVERYDRRAGPDGALSRLHQEDFCQALGVEPGRKYEADGGPGLKACFALLEAHSSEPILDKRGLLRAVVFNHLIGNRDAHAKNFSLLLEGGAVRLAPFYDLLSTKVYGSLSPKYAMRLGGQLRGEWVAKGNWLKLAEEAGVGAKAVLGVCEELGGTLPAAARALAERFLAGHGGEKTILRVVRHVEDMGGRMLEALRR